MPEKGPAYSGQRVPNQDVTARADADGAGRAGSWSLVAKIGASAFGTIIAPILVALLLKRLDSPPPPAIEPAVAQVEQKTEAEPKAGGSVAMPVSTKPVVKAEASVAKVAPSAPAVSRLTVVPKPEPAAVSAPEHHKVKKKKSAAIVAEPVRPSPGFTVLLSGRDLSGWTGGDKRWSVDLSNQSLVGHDLTATKGNQHSWLYTEKSYSDFRLRLEYRALQRTDTGIALRVSPGARLEERFEIQLLGDQDHVITTGTIIGLRKDQAHPHTKPAKPVALRPAGEWNLVEVDFRGQRLRLAINGQAVQDVRFDQQSSAAMGGKKMSGSGRIALQSREGHVEFRRVEIQELTQSTIRQRKAKS